MITFADKVLKDPCDHEMKLFDDHCWSYRIYKCIYCNKEETSNHKLTCNNC